MTKQQLLDKLQSSDELVKIAYVPVSEVINWVNELESSSVTEEMLNDIADAVVDEFHNLGTDIIEDYELEMNYREVELSSVDFDGMKIKRAIKEALSEYLEEEGN